jgi:hypothetical protein
MGNSGLEPQTEYVDAIQRKMPAWKRASIGAAILAVVIILALTANIWLPALATILVFCGLAVIVIALVVVVVANMFVKQGPTLADYQAIEEAREKYGLFQQPVVDGTTVDQQTLMDAFAKIVDIQATQGQEIQEVKQEIAGVKTGIDEILLQLQKVAHSNDIHEAPANEAAISVPPSVPPTKAEVNRAKLVRWVRANRDVAQTMDVRKIAKATGVNRNTTGRFISDYREGKITV